MKNNRKTNPKKPTNNLSLFIVCIVFAILNLASLRTGCSLLSYLSVCPLIYLIVECFSRIMK